MSVIELNSVTKIFTESESEPVIAVDDITLTINKGEIFSLVGPDGAGKTTSIRLMCGVLPLTKGKIRILGYDIQTQKDEVKKRIGYLSQRFSLYHDLTIDENIDFFAEIHKVKDFKRQKEELLGFMRLTPFRGRLAGKLSGGMKQKLALACTLIHAPEIIFLDEPTTGVDPVSRRDFWKILSSLLKSGITIVVSTPYLDEAERSSRVVLINKGKILQCDTPEAIKSSFHSEIIELVCSDIRRSSKILQKMYQRVDIQLFGDRLHLLVRNAEEELNSITRLLEDEQIEIISSRIIPPSLEDVFISKLIT
jgi:ABC-2 type transport system ATP-binding protein